MRSLAKYKSYILLILSLIVVCVVMYVFKIPCPIKFFSGVSCAGCGMSRAWIAAVQLDFTEAFRCHPLWFALPLVLVALVLAKVKEKERIYNVIITLSAIALMAVWLYRLIWLDGDVVTFEPSTGAVFRIFSALKDLICNLFA